MTDVQMPPNGAQSNGVKRRRPLVEPASHKRPRYSLDDDSEDEDPHGKVQVVSHFDNKAGGAIDVNGPKKQGPLIIKAQSNRDWKEAGRQRRQRSALPGTEDASAIEASVAAAEARESNRTFGLNIMTRDDAAEEQVEAPEADPEVPQVSRARTIDEQAMDALLGVQSESTLVVPAVTETDAFRDDFKSAPDMASLDDYARVPVEEFGAAMLRGMGWKGGDALNKGVKPKRADALQRRPALLGIGAKADAAIDAEMGGWGKAARGKEIKIYNPVLLKDKRTGELLTEVELQQKKEQAQRMVYEDEFERKEKDKERRRRRDGTEERHRERDDRRNDRRRDERHHDDRYRSRQDDSRDRYSSSRREDSHDRYSSSRRDDRDRYDSRRHRDERDRSKDDRRRRERDRSRDDRRYDDDRRRRRSRDRSNDRNRRR